MTPTESRPQRTELVFLLDRSGSMAGLEADVIGGCNAMIRRQQLEAGECRLTTVLFDHRFEVLHERVPLTEAALLTTDQYQARGSTALLDAVGRAIQLVSAAQESDRADRVLMAITTDGMENASREFTYDRIRSMISEKKQRCGWEFLFLGANIDAAAEAENLGVDADKAVRFHADSTGIQTGCEAVCRAASSLRACGTIADDWKEEIEADFCARTAPVRP